MPSKEHAITMARYNAWQNESLYSAADQLSADEREKERGAFFGSIHQTASHLLWGDSFWMSRFAGTPAPGGSVKDSTAFAQAWDDLRARRKALDQTILRWAHDVPADWFEGELCWHSAVAGGEVCKPRKILATHFFNHQTHHRGQMHAMLTAAGAVTEDTDLLFMPESFASL